MEDAEQHCLNMNENKLTFDFSKQGLKKIESATNEQSQAVILILNFNEIQKLDNLDSYANLKELFLANNQLIRMYGISSLIQLETLDMTNNLLVTIEGLKDLKNLKKLYLAKNKIKGIEHLNNNLQLEKIDLSENCITHISDISYLENLKELYLHKNKITNLSHCEKTLPQNLEIITLHNNLICDLNEISHFVHLQSLKELSFDGNPCVDFKDNNGFNYRPFIKNWCSNLVVLDKILLDDIECLKAEWLYSQGRGRSFRPGENTALAEYLSSVCPYIEPNGETEDVKKLKLILSKAQQHQQQLQEELSTGMSRISEHHKTPNKKKLSCMSEKMVSSFQDFCRNNKYSNDFMTKSLDLGILRNSPSKLHHKPLQTSTTFIPVPDTLISPDVCNSVSPFVSCPKPSLSNRTSRSSSRNSTQSTPESKQKVSSTLLKRQNCSPLMLKKDGHSNVSHSTNQSEKNFSLGFSPSPSKKGAREIERSCGVSSDEDGSTVLYTKLDKNLTQKRISKKLSKMRKDQVQMTACPMNVARESNLDERILKNLKETLFWKAAICIQRHWRGYRARNINEKVLMACKELQILRMQEYITKIVSDVESTRIAIEGNRKLQILQIQAINAVWKKIIAFQPNEVFENSCESKLKLQALGETCANLNKQVEELHNMIKEIKKSAFVLTVPNASVTQTSNTTHIGQEENKKLRHKPLECSCFSPSKELASPTFLIRHSKNLVDEAVEILSKEPDVTELFSNRHAQVIVSSSSQEIFLSSTNTEEKEAKYTNVKLNKPFIAVNEISPEIHKSDESILVEEETCEKNNIKTNCDS